MGAWVQRAVGVVVAAGVAMACAGCDFRKHFYVRDTEGGHYRIACADGACGPEIESPQGARAAGCTGGARAGFALAGRRVVVACHACVGGGRAPAPELARCRALQCTLDRDCPPRHAGADVRCTNGLCQAAGHAALDLAAAAGLCMSGAGPNSSDRPLHGEDRMAFARAACDASGRCSAPAGCRVP